MHLDTILRQNRVVAVADMAYGDSGKGKVTHRLASSKNVRIVVRSGGGPNTGATIFDNNGQDYKLHLIPVSAIIKDKINVVTGEVLFDVNVFNDELRMLKERGHQLDSNSLVVDFNLPVIMPYGIAFDISREISSKIGTTCRGVGPTVEDFVNRYNSIRLNDLFDKNKLEEKLELILGLAQLIIDWNFRTNGSTKKQQSGILIEKKLEKYLNNDGDFSAKKIAEILSSEAENVKPFVKDARHFLLEKYRKGDHMVLEGTQGYHLDVLHGLNPFTTSSPVTPNGILYTSGLPQLDYLFYVVKAIPTKVGSGPLPTEVLGKEADTIRNIANEFGATTGRPRRIFWPDLIMYKDAMASAPVKRALVINKLDIALGMTIKVYDTYARRDDLNNKNNYRTEWSRYAREISNYVGVNPREFGSIEDISGINDLRDLKRTPNAGRYIVYLQESLDTNVIMVGKGPKAYDTIE